MMIEGFSEDKFPIRHELQRRILVYANLFYPSIGGMQAIAETLSRSFVALGHSVTLVTESAGDDPKDFPSPIVRQPSTAQLFSHARDSDVILCMPLNLKRIGTLLAARRPIVVRHPHEMADQNGHIRLRDRVRRVIASRLLNVTQSRYMAAKIPNSILIPNSYNEKIFQADGVAPLEKLLFVGRLDRNKGCDVLLEAFKCLTNEYPNLTITVIGDGPIRRELTELAEQLEIGAKTAFLGALGPVQVASEMQKHGIMVIPSRYREPFGIVALEALACGCLPVVSEDGGLVDAIGSHGLTHRNGDVSSLTAALRAALSDVSLRNKLLSDVGAHLEKHHALVVARRYIAVLNQARLPSFGVQGPLHFE